MPGREYQERVYRQLVCSHLTPARITVQETDLTVYGEKIRPAVIRDAVIEQRGYIEGYIRRHPEFNLTLLPWPDDPLAPPIVREMIAAGQRARVGPMAGVAGAIAEMVGRSLLNRVEELIIENGGDIFLTTQRELTVAIWAGQSALSLEVGIKIKPSPAPQSICTSSGSIGHSLSYGKADAVCVIGATCALADVAATSIGNHIKGPDDIESAIQWGRSIPGVLGILAIISDKMGVWGDIELTSPNLTLLRPFN